VKIPTLHERKRGCGYRTPGGLYLMGPPPGEPCSLLPIELAVCPTCGSGFKPSRGWTWIEPDPITGPGPHQSDRHTKRCPLGEPGRMGDRAGLIWIGEQFYRTPAEFMREAADMGISRRIGGVPNDYVPGKTWVLLAHRKALIKGCQLAGQPGHGPEFNCHFCGGSGIVEAAGIFTAYRPTHIEYVVKGDEDEDTLRSLWKRGIKPVKVVPVEDQAALPA